jgi:uncharacterized protein YkwD
MRRIGQGLLVVIAALALASTALAGPTATSRTASATAMQTLDGGVLFELNQIRVQHGLVPLTLDSQLSAAAEGHSAEMLQDGYFAHNSFDGKAFWTRLTAYTNGSTNGGWSVGENLLWSAPGVDASQALKLWMASPEHRANILNAKWRQIGVSALHAGDAPGTFGNQPVTIITTDFGVRS